MKILFVLLSFIGMIHVSGGIDATDNSPGTRNEIKNDDGTHSQSTPSFTQLDGNLFLAIKTESQIKVADGDVVEFIFSKKTKLVSFHVNEINQDLIDSGEANIFVMVHNDLALSLKSHRLQKINIRHNNKVYSLSVNEFWTPDQFMTSL